MMRIFRDDSLPPDVLCLLVTDGDDTAIITNGSQVGADPARVREAINSLLAAQEDAPSPTPLRAVI